VYRAEISEYWQMIESERRRVAAMRFGVFQFEPFIKIDVIEIY
jgi:hypothetical protein